MKVICIAAITNATYNRNNKAPKTESCSTPWVIEVKHAIQDRFSRCRCLISLSCLHVSPVWPLISRMSIPLIYSCLCFCHSPCFSLCFPWSFPSCFPEGVLVSIWMTSETLYLLFLDILCHSKISQPLFFLRYSQIVPSLFTQNRLLKALCYKSIY